jgi:hypothetical protein
VEKEKARKKMAKRNRKVEQKKVMGSVQIQEKQKAKIILKEEYVNKQSKNSICFYMQILFIFLLCTVRCYKEIYRDRVRGEVEMSIVW